MKLSHLTSWLTALSPLVALGHGAATGSAATELHKRMPPFDSRAGAGRERVVTIFIDVLPTDGITEESPPHREVFPAHCFVEFSGTADEGPVRVELVSPTLDGQSKGISVAVTEYLHPLPGDGHIEWPQSVSTQRVSHRLSRTTTLTNRQIFDDRLSSNEAGRPMSLVESVWLDDQLGIDNSGSFDDEYAPNGFYFVNLLLRSLPVRWSVERLPAFLLTVLEDSLSWAGYRNPAGRNHMSIDYLFYEISPPNLPPGYSPPPEDRGVYGMLKRDGAYSAHRLATPSRFVNLPIGQPPVMMSPGQPPVLVLSRDARLTSAVVPVDQLSFLDTFFGGATPLAEGEALIWDPFKNHAVPHWEEAEDPLGDMEMG